jgi:hypothetical protein
MPSTSPSNTVGNPVTAQPSSGPTACLSPSLECLANTCVAEENTNLAIFGCGHSVYVSERGYINGPIDGNTTTHISDGLLRGSTYESTDEHVPHWWEVNLHGTFTIAQVKIFGCEGESCHPEGKKLDQIRVDIFNGLTIVSTYAFFHDQAPVLDLIFPIEVQGQIIRVTKMQNGKILSLSEVQVIGR